MELREQDGKAYIRGFSFEEIAEKYGTPFYLYDLDTIKEKIRRIREAFGNTIELYYAIKANPNLEILKAIREDVDGLDISSSGEMEQSLLAGYDAGRLSFAGPGKTRTELRAAMEKRVGAISVESVRELRDIHELASATGVRANIAFRINPRLLIKDFGIKMGGKATQFGIDEEEVAEAAEYVRSHEGSFRFLGIHVYAGTQCMNEEAIVRNVSNTLEIARSMRSTHNLECQWINLGGGWGVSYHEEHGGLNLELISDGISTALRDYASSNGDSRPRFIVELGRYLVAEAGIYVARVVSEKISRGERFFVLDGGMNHHLAASGNLGSTLRKNYVLRNLSRPGAHREKCNIVGPLCTPLDLLGMDILVESPRLGNLIGVMKSGSYGLTASPLFFLGNTTPAEVLIHQNRCSVIRNRAKLSCIN